MCVRVCTCTCTHTRTHMQAQPTHTHMHTAALRASSSSFLRAASAWHRREFIANSSPPQTLPYSHIHSFAHRLTRTHSPANSPDTPSHTHKQHGVVSRGLALRCCIIAWFIESRSAMSDASSFCCSIAAHSRVSPRTHTRAQMSKRKRLLACANTHATYTHTHTNICAHARMNVHTHAHIHRCTCACAHTRGQRCVLGR